MPWVHSTTKKTGEAKRVSTLQMLARFIDERELLLRLALLITGDIKAAELSVFRACRMATDRANLLPTRERLTDWVRWVAIKAAIANSLHEIAPCEPKYVNQTCTHAGHLLHGNELKLRDFRDFLFLVDPEIVIAELDPLARAVAVLRTTARASILDCTLRLRVSPDTVLAANCHAMTWIAEQGDRSEAGVVAT